MVIGIFCNCGGIHENVEEWKECPMSGSPQQIEQDWCGTTPDNDPNYYASVFASIILNLALIFIIFPAMYACIGLAKIADGWNRLRLRKRSDAAIQEPAKSRPRRAF